LPKEDIANQKGGRTLEGSGLGAVSERKMVQEIVKTLKEP